MIEDFGSYLKSERELRGVPLEEVSTTTKIHIRFLQALEKNQFDDLPGEVFVKGYIRSISKVIGSNEEEMLSAYDEAMKKTSSDKKIQSVPVEVKTKIDKTLILKLGLIIIFLAGLGWGLNILIQKTDGDVKQSAPVTAEPDQMKIEELPINNLSDTATKIENEPPKTLKSTNSLSEKPIQSVNNFSEVETTENTVLDSKVNVNITANMPNNENNNSVSETVSEGDTPLKLSVKVKDNVWFNIAVDQSRVEDFILPKGTEKIFYGKEDFTITLGNRNVVDLTLNDKILNLPNGDKDNIVQEFIVNTQLLN